MTWAIGELAARFGLSTHVLRHWEAVGLLAPLGGRAAVALLDHAAECPAADFRSCPDFTAKVAAYVSAPPAGRTAAEPAFG